jgi:hypothetical protein
MGCEIVAKTGRLLKSEVQSLVIEDQSVDENHIVCEAVMFQALLGAGCTAKLVEAILTIKEASAAPTNALSVYLFNTDPGTVAANDEIDLSTLYTSLLGIIDFDTYLPLNTNTNSIQWSKGIVRPTGKGNINIQTASSSSLIYALVFNEGSTKNFTGNTINLTLKIERD